MQKFIQAIRDALDDGKHVDVAQRGNTAVARWSLDGVCWFVLAFVEASPTEVQKALENV